MQLDTKDQEIMVRRTADRNQIETPRKGDFVRFPTGEKERFSWLYADAVQTSPGGSFFLHEGGGAEFSGSLHPSIPMDSLTLSKEKLDGTFWFFHHGEAGAGRGVYFDVPCRVYQTTAPYRGYLAKVS
ncbi:MAG: hypothetical protein PHV02_07175 [Rhodocyclaceae bacterium]|nr:hypothetical protein [Rhodocyclaceae bacterium]